MDILQWIKDRLPSDHTFTDSKILEVLNDPEGADGVKELALADLLDILAKDDKYSSIGLPGLNLGQSLLSTKAEQWRKRAPVGGGSAGESPFSFVPILGRQPSKLRDEYGG